MSALDGLSIENSACQSDSQTPGLDSDLLVFAGDFAGDLTGDCGSRCRCNDLTDLEGDFDRCRVLLVDAPRDSRRATEGLRTTCLVR